MVFNALWVPGREADGGRLSEQTARGRGLAEMCESEPGQVVDREEVMCSGTSGRGEEGHKADMSGIKQGAAWEVETNARKP